MIVRNEEELNEARKTGQIYVKCVCPKCEDESTLLLANAEKVIKNGKCLYCDLDENSNEYTNLGVLV